MTSTTKEVTRTSTDGSYAGGLALALTSATSFGLSGSLAFSLLDMGWSPAAVVVTRVGGAFLVLLIPALMWSRWALGRHSGLELALGLLIGTATGLAIHYL